MQRERKCLNGAWDFMPLYGVEGCLELPGQLSFEKEKIIVPSIWCGAVERFKDIEGFDPFNTFGYPKEWCKAETGVLRRMFIVPQSMQGGRLFLRFDGIAPRSRVYLNSKAIADWDEMYLPLKIDITDEVKDGENELVVVCTEFVQTALPSGQVKTLGLVGSWFGYMARGIWQDVYLESGPDVYVEDAFVATSVQHWSVNTSLSIINTTDCDKKTDIIITIYDEKDIVKTITMQGAVIPANGKFETDISEGWDNPVLWTTDFPHLYRMEIALTDSENTFDTYNIRFGFREVTIEGHIFKLNGVRINLRGDSWHFQGAVQQSKQFALNWYRMCKENGVNCIRLHAEPHPEYYLDAADEAGMLIIDETAIYGSAKTMAAAHPLYIERCKKHVWRLVKRDRNHPCIITWSLQNEMRWVDGRDTYKLHIPEMMNSIRMLDPTRSIIVEGDNRLLSKENTEIESMHYNIDGTIMQWDKTRPLFFGEHGGWWYICPQNSSMYAGFSVYLDFDSCLRGVAFKEKLFIEYARRHEVTGISTFNFAHYFMQSMPNEDVRLNYDDLETPGCKPQVIRKNSLAINNGELSDYPLYIPNSSLEIIKEAFRPVTVIPAEYDTSFYNDKPLIRSFDVYNDTLYKQNCRLDFKATMNGTTEVLFEKSFEFEQEAGEKKNIALCLELPQINRTTEVLFTAELFHNEEKMHSLEKIYTIYPYSIKTKPMNTNGKKIACYADGLCYEMISAIVIDCTQINNIDNLEGYDVLIIGSYANKYADKFHDALEKFVASGGVVLQLEQSKFAVGDLSLTSQQFFSAHIGCPQHPVFNGLTDKDFMFWKPYTVEEKPQSIIESAFIKPVFGDINMLLECSAGDFGDGGDLWTPLIEYRHKKGLMLLNQLEITSHYDSVPQACVLLRNMLQYAVDYTTGEKAKTAALVKINGATLDFLNKVRLTFDIIDIQSSLDAYNLIIADGECLDSTTAQRLRSFADNGGKVLVLPVNAEQKSILEDMLGTKVKISNVPSFQLKIVQDCVLTNGISPCDLFGFDKEHLTPRQVENRAICNHSIEIEDAESLVMSITGEPWYDYFVNGHFQEFSRLALVSLNKESKSPELPYLVDMQCGKGSIAISQVIVDAEYEKSIRVYSRLFSNLGAHITGRAFSYQKSEQDYAVEYFMVNPHHEHNDYAKEEAYFADKEYSLNNLGEGLYGWMKKIEKDKEGYITIPQSKGKKYFMSCFIEWGLRNNEDGFEICRLDVNADCAYKLWLNGELKADMPTEKSQIDLNGVKLNKGLNRLIIMAEGKLGDIRVRPVFRALDGNFLDDLRYKLTIDEVDPK